MASYHARSVSFPSTSHPLAHQFDEQLCRLKSSESTSSSSSSSLPSISNRLSGLEDLYSCVYDLLPAPHSQLNLANEKLVDQALDGYLCLLDVCVNTKDIFSQTKEDVQQLLSSIRRINDSNFQGYVASRKKTIKVIRKLLQDLKSISSKTILLESHQDKSFSMLKEAQEVTVSILESLLSNIAGTKAHSKSLISKLLQQKNGTKEVSSEFEQIDIAMKSLKNTETLQNQLRNSELSIENVEEVLERLIRRLIKTRVSLLNILTH